MTKAEQRQMVRLAREANRFTLAGFRLSESHTKLGVFRSGEPPKHAKQNVQVHVAIKDDRTAVQAGVDLRIEVGYEDSPESEAPISMMALFVIEYQITKPPLSDAVIAEAVPPMAMMMVWAYWREFVHSMSARMGLSPLPIPIMYPRQALNMKAEKSKQRGPSKQSK
jgi:hypothetical protein